MQITQGDVYLEKVNVSNFMGMKEVKPDPQGRLILIEGEVTGHAHAVDSKHAALYLGTIGMLLVVKKATELMHEEHDNIPLKEGTYVVKRQREYTPEEIKYVQD